MKDVAQQNVFPPDNYIGKVFWCDSQGGDWVMVRARTSLPTEYHVEAKDRSKFLASFNHLKPDRPPVIGPMKAPKPW